MTTEIEVKLVEMEALRVGPDDVLIIKGNLDGIDDEERLRFLEMLGEQLVHAGLRDRCLVIDEGDNPVELAVVSKPGAGTLEVPTEPS